MGLVRLELITVVNNRTVQQIMKDTGHSCKVKLQI